MAVLPSCVPAVETGVSSRAGRRRFTVEYKTWVVQEAERLRGTGDVGALLRREGLRREFFGHERLVTTLYRAIMPDPVAVEFSGKLACIRNVAEMIRTTLNPNHPDISMLMEGISDVLDNSIAGMSIPETPGTLLELSKIDFDALAQRFKKSESKNTSLEVLKAAIRAQMAELIQQNKTRADYADKFEELIESYNFERI